MEIKRFLGYTDNLKEPYKTKAETVLKKCHCYEGRYYNGVEFLCVNLLRGFRPEVKEDYQYYKRNGELSKPKTLYKYVSADGSYFELKKTEYNFVVYLLDNDITSEEKMLATDKADVLQYEAMQRAAEEEIARQEKLEQMRKAEKEEFERWMFEEAAKVPNSQKELISAIFFDIYGQEHSWNYSLAVCINNYDKPLCKREVISRLHNDNKGSIKVFECLTGLKLPKTYKLRAEFLEKLTAADFTTPITYKPRKKART